jgi:hypothetical protein
VIFIYVLTIYLSYFYPSIVLPLPSVNGAGSVCDENTSKFHGRIRGYKWSLLKIRERKYKEEHGGPRWKPGAKRAYFCSFRCF